MTHWDITTITDLFVWKKYEQTFELTLTIKGIFVYRNYDHTF